MVRVELINRENRPEKRSVLESVSKAIFGSQTEIEFSEQFVPRAGRVPNPKVSNFTNFLINVPNCLWIIFIRKQSLDLY